MSRSTNEWANRTGCCTSHEQKHTQNSNFTKLNQAYSKNSQIFMHGLKPGAWTPDHFETANIICYVGPQCMRISRTSWPCTGYIMSSATKQSHYICVNYNHSLTWIKAIWGWFCWVTMIPGLGRSEVAIIYQIICWKCWHSKAMKDESKVTTLHIWPRFS